MRSLYALSALLPLVLACDSPESDACASYLSVNSASATAFCATYTQTTNTATSDLPNWASACKNRPKLVSSACSCQVGPVATVSAAATKSSAEVTATSTTSSTFVTLIKSSSALAASSTQVVTTSVAAVQATSSSAAIATTAAASAITGGASVSLASGGTTCTVTEYAGISSAVASCTNILLSDITAPASSTIDLSSLQTGTSVIFAGETTFETTEDSDFDPIIISGTDIVISGADGHVIDGNGEAYWDGEGSNGGSDKPNHFIVAKKLYNARIENLNIQNWPVHCFYISSCEDITFSNILLNNTAGDEPNSASGSKAAAHNSDGFDIASTNNLVLTDSTVYNQDDCVAITSGSNMTVNNMYCSGGIGSIGGKSSGNDVSNVQFLNSVVTNSQNGCRIKSNAGETGSVTDILYSNITLSGLEDYGIDIQQDYENGGATGEPTNGVTISGITFTDVTGTMSDGTDYYILCGSDSCSDFSFSGVSITGGSDDSCNYPSSGCPS